MPEPIGNALSPLLRRLVVLGAPLLLGLLEIGHPAVMSTDTIAPVIASTVMVRAQVNPNSCTPQATCPPINGCNPNCTPNANCNPNAVCRPRR